MEDHPPTASLFKSTLQELACSAQLFIVGDGIALFHFLHRRPPYEQAPAPDLLILDLRLPGEDGFTLLERVRQDAQWCHLPAVFFSMSFHPADTSRAAALGALRFVHKPQALTEFEAAVEILYSLACLQSH